MKDYTVYTKIQQLKGLGFKPSNVAAQLGIHRNTVKKYWNMDADNFQEAVRVINRIKLLTDYQRIILKWLTDYPVMSAAQVCDWLKEYYQASFSERTVSRYRSYAAHTALRNTLQSVITKLWTSFLPANKCSWILGKR